MNQWKVNFTFTQNSTMPVLPGVQRHRSGSKDIGVISIKHSILFRNNWIRLKDIWETYSINETFWENCLKTTPTSVSFQKPRLPPENPRFESTCKFPEIHKFIHFFRPWPDLTNFIKDRTFSELHLKKLLKKFRLTSQIHSWIIVESIGALVGEAFPCCRWQVSSRDGVWRGRSAASEKSCADAACDREAVEGFRRSERVRVSCV